MKSLVTLLFVIALIISPVIYAAETAPLQVASGKTVKINYTLTVEGKVVDSSEGREPLQYTQGTHQIIPGLEKQMEGLKVGDERDITVKAEEGYGLVNPKAFAEVPKSKMPQGELKVGAQLHSMDKDGQPVYGTISEVKADSVIMNFNHPLAGKELHFKIKVIDIAS